MASKRTEELLKWDREHIIHPSCITGQGTDIVFEKGKGITLVDTDGNEYIDMSSQLVCCNLGYGQKRIIDAVTEAINRTGYTTSFWGVGNIPNIECSRKLTKLTPGDLNHFFFTSGGSETIDSAIKLVRQYWHNVGKKGKYKIISLYDSYHGESGISTYVTGEVISESQNPFGPPPVGFLHIPSYNCYRCMLDLKYPECNIKCARYLEQVIKMEGADSIAAVIAEPIQGSAGIIVPPDEWWPIVREICTRYDILLIDDEVMAGFARTGKMFAIEHWNVQPDVMTMAKGITAAYLPFGAVAVGDKVYEGLKGRYLEHGFTYSGHPIPSAASCAAMDIYVEDKVVENAAKVGSHIRQRLDKEFLPLPCVGTVGGKGMFQAVELVTDKQSKTIIPSAVKEEFRWKLFRSGIFLRITGALGNRMFFCPPCIMTIEQADRALDIIQPLVAELKAK